MIYITCLPRSGSTLLRNILASHPLIVGHRELHPEKNGLHLIKPIPDKIALYKEALSMHVPFLKRLKKLQLQHIHITRNPYDTLVSYYKTGTQKNFRKYGRRYLKAYPYFKDNFEFHQLRYEDLVKYPKATILDLCDYLKIKFYPIMLEYHLFNRDYEVDHYSEFQAKKNIFTESINQWDGCGTKKELKLCKGAYKMLGNGLREESCLP